MSEPKQMPLKRPPNAAELCATIRTASTAGAQVRTAGSNSLPLAVFDPQRPVHDLSTLRMNKILDHAVSDMTVVVEAGISLEALQRQLAWHNQWMPIDPPIIAKPGRPALSGQRTLGGLIASNSLGPLRFGCGDWRLLVMGMTWVDGRGTLIRGGGRTVKNVAGYNSPRLMIGSAGCLGAIAEITLRTFARPIDEQCVIFFCDSHPRAEALLAEIMISATTPAYIQAIGGATFSTNPLQLPTMQKGLAVAVGFLDRPASCSAQIDILRRLPAAVGIDSISQTAAQAGRLRQWMTTEPAVQSLPDQEGVGFRVSVLSSQTCSVIAAIEDLARVSSGSAWVVAEAGTGVVRGVITTSARPHSLRKLLADTAPGHHLLVTQGGISTQPHATDDLAMRIKRQLDPQFTFGCAIGPSR